MTELIKTIDKAKELATALEASIDTGAYLGRAVWPAGIIELGSCKSAAGIYEYRVKDRAVEFRQAGYQPNVFYSTNLFADPHDQEGEVTKWLVRRAKELGYWTYATPADEAQIANLRSELDKMTKAKVQAFEDAEFWKKRAWHHEEARYKASETAATLTDDLKERTRKVEAQREEIVKLHQQVSSLRGARDGMGNAIALSGKSTDYWQNKAKEFEEALRAAQETCRTLVEDLKGRTNKVGVQGAEIVQLRKQVADLQKKLSDMDIRYDQLSDYCDSAVAKKHEETVQLRVALQLKEEQCAQGRQPQFEEINRLQRLNATLTEKYTALCKRCDDDLVRIDRTEEFEERLQAKTHRIEELEDDVAAQTVAHCALAACRDRQFAEINKLKKQNVELEQKLADGSKYEGGKLETAHAEIIELRREYAELDKHLGSRLEAANSDLIETRKSLAATSDAHSSAEYHLKEEKRLREKAEREATSYASRLYQLRAKFELVLNESK